VYRLMRECVTDLERAGHLVRLDDEVDADLEAAEIHRRVLRSGGPAVLYTRVKGCRFPMVSNLFGTMERARFLFRDSLDDVKRLIELKLHPAQMWQKPSQYAKLPFTALAMLPWRRKRGAVLAQETTISQLPQVRAWPGDAGAFIMMGQVYTENADEPGLARSNLGMYRIQMSGGRYERDREVGLHYQIHRGIGVHHAAAVRRGEPFRVNIFVGGTPAMSLAAVMPLPEGMSELGFAGALARQRIRMICRKGELPIYADADFCITGTVIHGKMLPEGPFGDHLGYYSLAHNFPVLRVEHVYHRDDAIWPFTIVGRPPQEDTIFGQLIHELTGPVIPTVVPGVHAVHAVDVAGVHPLMLAIGSERYTPYAEGNRPQELLTQANAILGQGQMSLAKYLFIVNRYDDPALDVHEVAAVLAHVLRRVDWQRDLHFHTCTTIDTLDYSGSGLNEGSKVVIAAVGPPRRELPRSLSGEMTLPPGFEYPRACLPGVLAIEGPDASRAESFPGAATVAEGAPGHGAASTQGKGPTPTGDTWEWKASPFGAWEGADPRITAFCSACRGDHPLNRFPLVVIVDDSQFLANSLANFLWVTFTRSNPAADIYGVGSFVEQKHWGCSGSLVIDARIKPHHAPPLEPDLETMRKIDALASRGGPLARYL